MLTDEQSNDIKDFLKRICTDSILGNNVGFMHESFTDELKEKVSVSLLANLLVKYDDYVDEHSTVDDATGPRIDPEKEGFYIFEVFMTSKGVEYFASFSINIEKKINNFSINKKKCYVYPNYIKKEKIESRDISESPHVRYSRPAKRKVVKIPIAVLIHTVIFVNIDGQMYDCYPYRDFEYLAQKKIGLVRSQFDQSISEDPIINMATLSIDLAYNINERSGVYPIIHGTASLYLPEIFDNNQDKIDGLILVNPAKISPPGLNLPELTAERLTKVPKNIEVLIIQSEFDQVITDDGWKMWKGYFSNSTHVFIERCDHFILETNEMIGIEQYERQIHANVEALDEIVKWIRNTSK